MTATLGLALPKKTAYLSFVGPITEKNVETLIARVNAEMQTGATAVHLFLSSFGGSVAPGFTAYALLRGMPVELITHNVGNVGSIGNVVYLAGRTRYVCPAATFYFHGTHGGRTDADAATLQSSIEGINIDNDRTVDLIVQETGMNVSEVRTLISSVGSTRSAPAAVTCGLAHDVRDVVIPPGSQFFQLILPDANKWP